MIAHAEHIGEGRGCACTHCGLPVPTGLVREGAPEQFCCAGCETAYGVIHGCGLDAYYTLREASGSGDSRAARATGRRYAEFDDPTFCGLYCRGLAGALRQTELTLEGLHCSACVWLLEKLPTVAPGVVEARVDIRRATIRLVWQAGTPLSEVARTLDSLGYPAHPARNTSARAIRRMDDRRMLIRLAVAAACAGNVMLLALALYAGMFDEMEPAYRELFRWLSMGISLVSLAWPGRVFFRSAWSAVRTRTLHLDVPIALGLGAGAVWGVVNTVRGTGEIYFDSLSVLVFALLAGRWVQHRQQRWSADAVELLFSLTPSSVRLVRGAVVVEAPIEAVSAGDTVEVLAGQSIPVDGVVVAGDSKVDQSLLSGESRPVDVAEGDPVSAGALNLSGVLRIDVRATGEGTRVGKLMRMVEEGTRRRAPLVRLADRIAGWFVAGMLALAGGTAAFWLWRDPGAAIDHAAALLIVTCPCALGLATPLAVTVAVGRAAKRGILIKGGDAVQSLAGTGTMFLDKTGTITQGKTALVEWIGRGWARGMVSAVEIGSSHPVARALVEGCGPANLAAVQVKSYASGIEGIVGGRSVVVGSAGFVRGAAVAGGVTLDGMSVDEVERSLVARGLTPVLVAVEGRVVAAAGLGDPVREDAKESVARLRGLGWNVGVLSGDHPEIVAAVGRELALPAGAVRGGVAPEEKLAAVLSAARLGPVVMVGDGVNDAAALAAATVGIAVHGGAEASLAAADVYLTRPGLAPIVELVEASRRTIGVVRRNFAAALFYNALAATLAVTGWISPLVAAILMPASSLTVLTMSFRARTFAPRPTQGAQPCP